MTRGRSVKITSHAQIVGVIFSAADLARAPTMRRPPDLFELRLDALSAPANKIATLPAPLIVTARHPREGGVNDLPAQRRRELLLRFLPHATFIDVELRSAHAMRDVLDEARAKKIRQIISFHDLAGTPAVSALRKKAETAVNLGADFLKIATRVETKNELGRLLKFYDQERGRINLAVMGFGRFGRESRVELARRGSVLNYAHLGRARLPGQLSVEELRPLL